MWVLDDEEGMKIKYSYWHTEEPFAWEEEGTYANWEAKVTNKKSYEGQHSVGDILNSLIKGGLVIQEIGEYPDIWWQYVQEDGSYRIPGDRLPQMWSVKAGKP